MAEGLHFSMRLTQQRALVCRVAQRVSGTARAMPVSYDLTNLSFALQQHARNAENALPLEGT
jgi:hypothetical protein